MREIKFRAWVDDTMYDVDGIFFNPDGSVESIIITGKSKKSGLDVFTRLAPEDVILLQYTGIKDKNGKEIWEGDIVNVSWKDSWKTESEEHVGTVSFIDDYAGFMIDIQDIDAFKYFGAYYPDQIEVIGNIYENPELLEGGDDGRKRSIR